MNLKTIAQKAGVSTATVSNVINGNFHKVSEETRQKVEQIIKELDYKPNVMARSLATRESRIIGLVVPYISPREDFMINPYYAHMIAALERIVREQDYYLMIRSVNDCREVLPLLSSWNVDGAFFLGVFESDLEEICDGLSAPKVFIDSYTKKTDLIANVGIDDYRGGYLSARYLLGKGHRKIALVTTEYTYYGVSEERYRGFMDACREWDVTVDEKKDVYVVNTMYRHAIEAGQNIAFSERGYTAVSAMSDVTALGVLEGLNQCGVRVPEDMSVIGFDDLPECEYAHPKLTTIAQNFQQKAQMAADYLFQMIRNDEKLTVNVCDPIRVVERQSVRGI